MPEPELSIVVPCYNEEGNIPGLIERFARTLAGNQAIELVLVDNGSTDTTGALIEREIKTREMSRARKVLVPKNQGYGFGILSGLREARGNVLAWTHADLQTDPADVLKAYDLYRKEAAGATPVMVKGRRIRRGLAEAFFSWGMQTTASLALGCKVTEINAQPKLFPRAFLKELDNAPHDFSLDLFALYRARKSGYRILELPVDFAARKSGEAKGGSGSSWSVRGKLIKRTFCYIFELRRKIRQGA